VATRTVEEKRPLDADQLRAIEVALRGKLQAYSSRPSEAFIDRNAEDLIQQALTEYAKACEDGQEIYNPGGWVVNTAFRRALDQLRREGREASPISAELALETTDGSSASPEEEAISHIEVEQLHSAISRLTVPQRQALSLYYFEGKSTRAGADELGWSEPTFRRRRDSALRALRERFGVIEVPLPEQGDRLAVEIGVGAYLSLASAQGHASGIVDQLVAAADWVRSGAAALADRARDTATRLLSSGNGEVIANVASGPVGKTAGVCGAVVAAACAVGVVGPGVGGVDLLHSGSASNPPAVHKPPVPPAEVAPAPSRTPKAEASREPTTTPRRPRNLTSGGAGAEAQARRATHRAASQFAPESEAEPSRASSEPAPEASSAPASEASASPSPTQTANEQFGP
jgi:RNA polymerase sigma-70 factor, ECF subfamily